ncbi:MAG TPA: sulfur carrier protein ThiS [Jatrophihabitans sp.]|nr:sulfur carrier protein ThiS [Jatrophihabitans sp.]
MQIILNGQPHTVTAASLQELVRSISDRDTGIAVAVNSAVVPRSSWPSTPVNDGDRVDVVTAVQGG